MIFALPVLSTMGAAPVLAESGYSFEEQEACAGDAFRLCSEFIPNVSRITACMEAKVDQLSPKCARMFAPGRDRHLGETPPPPPPKELGQQSRDKSVVPPPPQARDPSRLPPPPPRDDDDKD